MWLLERLVPDSSPNNLSLAFRADGRLDSAALRGALTALVHRHEVLRTVYVATGADLMKTVLTPGELLPDVEEVVGFEVVAGDLERSLRPFVNRRFGFDGSPMVRTGLFHLPDGGDVVCIAFHHLVYDIISATTILEELVTAYDHLVAGTALPAKLLTTVPPFTEPAPRPESLDHWRDQLAGFDPLGLELDCGREAPAEPSLLGDHVTRTLSDAARASLRHMQRELRAPEAVVLLTAYFVLLAAHGAGPDIVVGSPVSVRPREDPRLVGHHTNVLPLRLFVDPHRTFRSLVLAARDVYFAALSHVDVPVDSIPGLAPQGKTSWHNRIYRHLFNYFPGLDLPAFTLGGTPARPFVVENGFNKFDMEFFVASAPEELRVIVRYGTDKFDAADAESLLLRYESLLERLAGIADVPTGELKVWSAADHDVIDRANDTDTEVRPDLLLTAVHARAATAPDSVAVRHGERTVSYRQLWDCAVATRTVLTALGVGHGDVVALAASRTPELIGAALGVWLAGAAYLPVDPEHPAQRVQYLLGDSGAKAVLTDRDLTTPAIPRLPLIPVSGEVPTTPLAEPDTLPGPGDPAYLIYTSGTSGRPKGALITHRSIANIAADYRVRLGATEHSTTLWLTTFAFDMANLELYTPLYTGGRIAIAADEARVSGQVLAEELRRYRPGIVQATPTTLRLVLDDIAGEVAGIQVVTGGETVPADLVRRLRAMGCRVHHAYGPTETVTWATWSAVTREPGDRLDIGHPIINTRVLVAGPDGRELPVGVTGELWIAGHGVALGYHDRPELTAARFGEHPVHGRFYRSGDLGRWRPDGTLELFGRADRQVKLRGNRIELGEVEATLLTHPRVGAAAVVVVGDRSADGHLVAFVEITGDDNGVTDELWSYARARLPRSALPQEFVVLDALPVSTNEKIDYVALEGLAGTGVSTSDNSTPAPADDLTGDLVELWRELLDRGDVGVDTNFFTNGGHSLLGAQLLQRVEEVTGTAVKLSELFAAPTPAELAQKIRSAGTA